ncbi:MAG: ABC transporter ATP-binding protein [Burkholderiales bacterium]|nr:ABC transporter ATP-binding protein [Burkholderiales bacterium]
MAETFLQVRGLYKRFGGLIATNDLRLDVERGETHAIIGPNGAGKTTLIAQLQGETRSDSGTVTLNGRDVTGLPAHARARLGVARSFQISSVFPEFSALQNVMLAVQAASGHNFRFWRRAQADRALTGQALQALHTIGIDHRADVIVSELSHGERRQLELAMALAMKPRLLLLDEPMAGMGRQDGLRITEILRQLKSQYTIVLVEHDMDVVFSLADRISVLVFGQCVATGTPAQISADERVRAAYLGHGDA